MVALPGRQWREPAALHASFVEHVLGRADCRAMVVLVRVGNDGATAFFQRFLELDGTGEVGARARVAVWSLARGAHRVRSEERGAAVRALRASDEAVVARGAERAFGSIPAAALSYLPGELTLPRTRRAFADVGLLRERRIDVVSQRGRVLAAVVDERSSPGVNLTFLLNATWLVPVHDDLGEDGLALRLALRTALAHPAQTATGERFLVTPETVAREPVERAGYRLEAHADIFAYNRAGLLRWYHYVHRSYGERAAAQALVARQEAS